MNNLSQFILPDYYSLTFHRQIKNSAPLNTCVAYALSSILEFYYNERITLSTNFIYGFYQRSTIGMSLKDGCDIIKNYGDCLLSQCPGNYEIPIAHNLFLKRNNIYHFYDSKQPYFIDEYFECHDNNEIKSAIFFNGPTAITIRWPEKYFINSSGVLINIKNKKKQYHTVIGYGWNKQGILCLNSYGKDWGQNGSFQLLYEDNLIIESIGFIKK